MASQSKSKDRRRARRVPMSAGASELDPRTTTPVSEVSETGCYVHTSDRLPVGALIELRFTVFPDAPILFAGHGRVVRHGDDPPGMGVEFVDLDDGAKDVVRKILLRDEAARRVPSLAQGYVGLRTHGLVARLVDERKR